MADPTDRNPIDRSLAFTALLEFEWFRRMEMRQGTEVITAFLDDFYASPDTHIWHYAQQWGHPQTGLAFAEGGWFRRNPGPQEEEARHGTPPLPRPPCPARSSVPSPEGSR